ncbi:MAG TPA: copper resistance protein NlpE N-terminal domain-containing protein [Melioribacteraceae bacterium]|nr:copper resistance protein NlpE N-terminal domain-containing protein [Melioribacteraceae bacterium]
MKIFFIIILLTFLTSCTVNRSFVDEHNAKNSIDWSGTYFGVTPCADCPGIETTLTLYSDLKFKLSLVYQERNVEPFIEQGEFKFDNIGNKITLFNNNKEVGKYFIGENYIIQLDADGNFFESELKDYFRLDKIKNIDFLESTWLITQFEDNILDSLKYFINFNKTDNRFSANFGCNKITGKYLTFENETIKFSDVISTKMACPNMDLEKQLLNALQKVDNYTFNNNKLFLTTAKTDTTFILIKNIGEIK